MSVKIEIYTKIFCTYCQRAKELLRIKGVNFVEYDITDDQVKAAELLKRSQQSTIPGIFINGTSIGSCAELFDLDEKGELDALFGPVTLADESFQ